MEFDLTALATALIRRALLDLRCQERCPRCHLPARECAERFLKSDEGRAWLRLADRRAIWHGLGPHARGAAAQRPQC